MRPIGTAVGGQVSPTPFVGGGGADLGMSDAESTRVRERPTDDSTLDRPPRRARWLIAVTAVALLVFLAGLGLLLFGPMPTPRAEVETPPDAGPPLPRTRPDAAPPRDPEPPAGMILVRHDDHRAWVFVDARAVSWDEIDDLFPRIKKPRGAHADDPATGVSWDRAQSYARARGKRLVRSDEWAAAAHTEGFVAAGKTLWEWVEDGAGETRPVRSVRSLSEIKPLAQRPPGGHGDVTFRLARDLVP